MVGASRQKSIYLLSKIVLVEGLFLIVICFHLGVHVVNVRRPTIATLKSYWLF